MMQKLDSLGRADAWADIDSGKLIVKWYGLPDGSESNYLALLRKRSGIFVDFVAGDVLSREEHTYWSAYNSVSAAEIARRYGKNALDSASNDARKLKEKGVDLRGTIPQHEKPEPYAIQVGPHAEFPENLLVGGAFGKILLDIDILKSGVIANPQVIDVDLYVGPYCENYSWLLYPGHHPSDDSVMQALRPWIHDYIKAMRLTIHDRYFSWLYQDTLHQSYEIRIRPEFEDSLPVRASPGRFQFPPKFLGPKDRCDISVECWVDDLGRLVHSKLSSILLEKYRGIEDGEPRYNHYYCSSGSPASDTSKSIEGNTWLFKRLKGSIGQAVRQTRFEVSKTSTYFNYFDVARTHIYFTSKRQ